LRPEYPSGLELRGRANVEAGLLEQKPALVTLGRADYDRALAIAPHDPWTHWSRAHLFERLGQPRDAMPEYLAALTLDRDALWTALPDSAGPSGQSTQFELQRAFEQARVLLPDPAATSVYNATALLLGQELGPAGTTPFDATLAALVALRAGNPTPARALASSDPFTLAVRAAASKQP
jgi:tetratricopeptide (TPR) repeat protein